MRNLTQRHWKVLFLFCLVGMDLLILDLSPWMGLMLRFRARFPMSSAFLGGAPLLWVVNGSLMVGLIGFGTYRNAARSSLWGQIVRLQKAVWPVFLGTLLFLFLIQSKVTQVRGVLFHSFVISYVLMLLGRSILYSWNAWMCRRVLGGEETWAVRTGSSAVVYQGTDQEESEGVMVEQWRSYETVKRMMDVVGAAIAMVLFAPLFVIIALAIKLTSRGPIIHKTSRLGRNGTFFTKYKFRTMVPNGEEELKKLLEENEAIRKEYERTYKIKNDPRVTSVGKVLRRTSLNELPQFFNILKGDMSLVGPRDIIPPELEQHYSQCKHKLLSVRPGLSGLWQVSGRSKLPYEERVRLDMYYIDHRSVWFDVKILLRTVLVVLKGDGAV